MSTFSVDPAAGQEGSSEKIISGEAYCHVTNQLKHE
jgi:hypothetical protein